MKTITGTIVSSKQVSISKAASILSKFVSAETGGSQAVNAYLRRATAAIDELARLHAKSDRRKQRNREPDAAAAGTTTEEASTRIAEASLGASTQYRSELNRGVDTESKDWKKKDKKEKSSGFVNSGNDDGKMGIEVKDEQGIGETNLGEEMERKKHKKRDKKGIDVKEEQGSGGSNLGEESERKKHKKRIEVEEEQGHGESNLREESERKRHKKKREKGKVGNTDRNQGDIGDKEAEKVEKDDGSNRPEGGSQTEIGEEKEERKKKKKKRKSKEIEVETGEGSEEQPAKKKKKKKRRSGEEDD